MSSIRATVAAFGLCVLGGGPLAQAAGPAGDAPPVARKHPKTTTFHGEALVDDYHWLRNKGTPEVEAHLNAELAYAQAFMKPSQALQQKLYDEMLSRIQQTDTNVPYRERGFYYYSRTEEGKQYAIYCRKQGSLDAPEQVILDVNRLAEGKPFMSVGDMATSPDGGRLAYSTDTTGFRQFTLRVKDLSTGKDGTEAVERVTSVLWAEDGATLFYSVEHPQTKRSYQVFRHRLGRPAGELVYEEPDERFNVYVEKTRDRKLIFVVSASQTASETRYLPADQPTAAPRLILPREKDHEYYVDHRDGSFWIQTNDKGRNFRLVTAPVSDPRRESWKEVLPHRADVMLEGQSHFKDFYVLFEREGGLPQLRVTDAGTGESHRIAFPERAYVAFGSTNREYEARKFRFSYQSPVTRLRSTTTTPPRKSGRCSSRSRCSAASTPRATGWSSSRPRPRTASRCRSGC